MKSKVFNCVIYTERRDVPVQITTTRVKSVNDYRDYTVPMYKNQEISKIMENWFFLPPRSVRLVHDEDGWRFVVSYRAGVIHLTVKSVVPVG